MTEALTHAHDLAAFVTASPSSFHAAAEVARRLGEAGFVEQDETAAFATGPGAFLVVRDGTVVAWRVPEGAGPTTPYRIVGAHTDSPGFVLKPNPDFTSVGWQQVEVEVYGGPLLNSWLDRELGLAGRLVLDDGDVRLVRTPAWLRIPQLAIHLDRAVNEEGVKVDRQVGTSPIWGVAAPYRRIVDALADLAGCEAGSVAAYDLVTYDTTAPAVFGYGNEFLASGRLDNLSSVHAGLTALIEATDGTYVTVLAAFDHEEVGSGSHTGAAGPVLADVLRRIGDTLGATRADHFLALAGSWCASSDAGHAVHPNYVGRHDPNNRPLLGGGPLLKINANQRYATDAIGAARWRRACASVGVETQPFVSSNAIPCGSTIGPITATRLGVRTVDVGPPLLSMHSVRELAGVEDQLAMSRALAAFLTLD